MRDDGYPRMLHVFLNAKCALGHHEFADSVNNGPWGAALTREFIPALEAKFHAFGAPAGPPSPHRPHRGCRPGRGERARRSGFDHSRAPATHEDAQHAVSR
jgi:hypothetical protein